MVLKMVLVMTTCIDFYANGFKIQKYKWRYTNEGDGYQITFTWHGQKGQVGTHHLDIDANAR